MMRLTGMDLKMEQYRKGERFVAEIERLAGAAALRRLWDGPETLPTPERDRRSPTRLGPPDRASTGSREGRVTDGGRRGRRARDRGPAACRSAIALTPILSAR